MPVGSVACERVRLLVKQVNGGRVRGKQLHHLEHDELQDLIQVKRLIEGDGDVVQNVQLAIAAADLVFRPLHLRYVQHQALVALDLAAGAARGKAALQHVDDAPIPAAQPDLKIPYIALPGNFAQEFLAVFQIQVE